MDKWTEYEDLKRRNTNKYPKWSASQSLGQCILKLLGILYHPEEWFSPRKQMVVYAGEYARKEELVHSRWEFKFVWLLGNSVWGS